MGDRKTSIREWGVLVRPDGNGVTQNQRTNKQGERSRVNRVPKETEMGRRIRIVALNMRSGRAGGL